jgi:O-antigen/teichoic acid export membrane protein
MSLKKNALLNLSGAAVPMVVMLVTVPTYLRLIGAERYGTLAIIWALMGYFGAMDLGLGRAITQRLASAVGRTRSQRSRIVWTALTSTVILGTVAGALIWGVADLVLTRSISMSDTSLGEARRALPWFVLAMPLILSNSVLHGSLQGRQRFVALNTFVLASTLLAQLLPLLSAALGFVGLDVLVPCVLLGRLAVVLTSLWYCRRNIPLTRYPTFDGSELRPLFSYGGWASVLSLIDSVMTTVDRIVIGAITGAASVAVYTIPYSITTRVMIVPGAIHGALFPRLSSLPEWRAREMAAWSADALSKGLCVIAAVGIPCIAPFLHFWIGADFAARASGVGEILLLGVVINGLAYPHPALLMATGRVRNVATNLLIEAPFYLAALAGGLHLWGVRGAALAWAARVTLDTLLLWRANRLVRASLSDALPSVLLVATVAIASISLPWESPTRWALACGVLLAALWRSRALFAMLASRTASVHPV